jgi:hypothetical protein
MAQPVRTAGASYAPLAAPAVLDQPVRQAYRILHLAFVLAPLVAGLDKFLDWLVNWDSYLAPVVSRTLHVTPHNFMMLAGIVEVVAAVIVAVRPRIGAPIVALWLWGIIANLFLNPNHYYDIALRDFGLSLGALALARLAIEFDRPVAVVADSA